jgi:hypothetical protein
VQPGREGACARVAAGGGGRGVPRHACGLPPHRRHDCAGPPPATRSGKDTVYAIAHTNIRSACDRMEGGAAVLLLATETTSVTTPHVPPLACGPPLSLRHACAGSLPPVAHIGGKHTHLRNRAGCCRDGRTGGTHNDTHHTTRTSARLRATSASAARLRWASSCNAQRHAHAHTRSLTPLRRTKDGGACVTVAGRVA